MSERTLGTYVIASVTIAICLVIWLGDFTANGLAGARARRQRDREHRIVRLTREIERTDTAAVMAGREAALNARRPFVREQAAFWNIRARNARILADQKREELRRIKEG